MADFPLSLEPQDHERAAAARDQGWVVWQDADFAWKLRTDDEALVTTVQAFLDGYDPLAGTRAEVMARLEGEADRRVDRLGTLASKLALLSRGLELVDKRLEGGTWTPEEAADAELSREANRRVRRIRRAAADIAADIRALNTTDELLAFDPAASPRWPQFGQRVDRLLTAGARGP